MTTTDNIERPELTEIRAHRIANKFYVCAGTAVIAGPFASYSAAHGAADVFRLLAAEGPNVQDAMLHLTLAGGKDVGVGYALTSHSRNVGGRMKAVSRRYRLTPADVRAIQACTDPYNLLAVRYGVSCACISKIKTGAIWRHLTASTEKAKVGDHE